MRWFTCTVELAGAKAKAFRVARRGGAGSWSSPATRREANALGSTAAMIVAALLGASSCVGEREFPRPAQMCENLVETCGHPLLLEHESDLFRRCYQVGLDGVKDQTKEAQCFAYYDECYNDCEFFGYYLSLDAGLDASLDAANELDARAATPDATTNHDE